MHPIQAIKAFFRVLAKGERGALPPPPDTAFQGSREPAIQLLALFQKEGRWVDFLHEDISSFSDEEIGAAVRPIHEKTKKLFEDRIKLEKVRPEAEGADAVVAEGYDASRETVVGNVTGEPPYHGKIRHGGWVVTELNLPTVPAEADPSVVQPAEIEV